MQKPIAKIQNLEQRMRGYQEDCRMFWRTIFAPFASFGVIIIFPLVYLFLEHYRVVPSSLDWWVVALILWAILMVPPYQMMYPPKPCPEDIRAEQELLRRAGLDSSVSTGDHDL